MFYERSENYRPLFWAMGRPIYVNTLIFVLHVLAFIVLALLVSLMGGEAIGAIDLDTHSVIHGGQVWRLVSYIIFPPKTTIMFIFAMGFLVYFGRQVEEYVGRKDYAVLYVALILLPALLLSLLTIWWPYAYLGSDGAPFIGGYGTIFGVFIAYATLYPGVEINIWFVNLTAKGWAYVLLGVLSLYDIAYHDWIGLGGLWLDAGIGYLGMRYLGAGRGMEWLTDWVEERRSMKLARQHNIKVLEDKKSTESIDAILDKISKQGVGSLDARERAALERARTDLLKRDQR